MLFDAKFTRSLQKCRGKLKLSDHVLPHRQNTQFSCCDVTATEDVFPSRHAHFVVWVYPEGFHVAVASPVVTA